MKRSMTMAVAITAVMAVAFEAHSYLPPSIQLLENMAARRAKLRLADVTALLTADVKGIDVPVEERIYLKAPERMRLVQERPDGTRLYIERESERAGGPEDAVKTLAGPSTDMLAALLMPRGDDNGDKTNRLMGLLRNAGVDTKEVALAIYGDDVRETAYIIGAKTAEEERPQLWIDRENSQPVRWVSYVKEDGERVRYETHFTGWGSPAGGAWFPETIETYRNGELLRRSELNELRTNERLPESLFELP